MKYIPSEDHVLARQITEQVNAGILCGECQEETFVKPLGTPTCCVECWNKLEPKLRAPYVKANRNHQQSVISAKAKHKK